MGDENGKENGAEKRTHPRVDFFSKVKVTIPDESTAVDVFAGNVSRGGMFLRSNRPLEKGKKVSLEFEVEAEPVKVDEGEVVWTKPFEPISIDGAPAGMGVRFNAVEGDSADRIASFIDEELGRASPEPYQGEQREPLPGPARPSAVSTAPDPIPPEIVESVAPDAEPAASAEGVGRMRLPIPQGSGQDPPPAPTTAEYPQGQPPAPMEQGEPLMVSEPPPRKTYALLYAILVLFVAGATFATLYLLKPFADDSAPATKDPPKAPEKPEAEPKKEGLPSEAAALPDKKPEVAEVPDSAAEPTKAPAKEGPDPAKEPAKEAAKEIPKEPAKEPAKDPPKEDPEPATVAGSLQVGAPVFRQASNGWRMVLKANAKVKTRHFTLKNPPRLAVDFRKATYSGAARTLDAPPPFISKIRVGEKPENTRFVLDFNGSRIPKHRVVRGKDRVTIIFSP